MPVRAFLDSDPFSYCCSQYDGGKVSMPVRAFLDSDGKMKAKVERMEISFNARQGIS